MTSPAPLVVIVEDDESFRKALVRLVQAAGHPVLAVESAEAFLDARPIEQPYCMLLDIRMSGLSGLELQQALVEADEEPPIVFLTGHGDVPTAVGAMKLGAHDFLTKPVDAEELLQALDRALQAAVTAASAQRDTREAGEYLERLTPREREVLTMVVTGQSNKAIGSHLGITEKTVKVHRGHIYEKLETRNLFELKSMVDQAREAASSGDSRAESGGTE